MSDAARFEEIMGEIKELVREAYELTPLEEKARARSYWLPHILGAIDRDNEYLGGSMSTMEETLQAMPEMHGIGECDHCSEVTQIHPEESLCSKCLAEYGLAG